MGWSGATEIFDGAVDVALALAPKIYNLDTRKHYSSPEVTLTAVREMYTKVNWDDWDTQDESKYYKNYLHTVMIELGEIDE